MGTNNIILISHDSYNHLYVLCYVCEIFDHHIVHGLPKNSKLVTFFILLITLNYFPCSFILVYHNTSQAHFVNITIFLCKNLKWYNLDIHKVIINIDCLFKLLDMTMWTYILLCAWPKLTHLLIYKYLIITYYICNDESPWSVRMGHNYKHDTLTW